MNSNELNIADVPLATCESDCEDFNEVGSNNNKNKSNDGTINSSEMQKNIQNCTNMTLQTGVESVTGSLEDLVNSFDEKITMCFQDYDDKVEHIAPIQVRTQEEIMSECQVWWTLTGNFGNILPIDWTKSQSRPRHLEALNLCEAGTTPQCPDNYLEDEDDLVAADLDMHSLILGDGNEEPEPIKSAEEVMKEIDDIIESADDPEQEKDDNEPEISSMFLKSFLSGKKLEELTLAQLTTLYSDVELFVKELSETLVTELSYRDELEYEKELKNTFISLLLSIQSKRRQHNIDKKGKRDVKESKYITTVIPYQPQVGTPSLHSLQVLVKILRAIDQDLPTVPSLLTDYILKILCPS